MTEWKTLTQELEELERTTPEVAEAARKWDVLRWKARQPKGSYFRRPKRRLTPGENQ